MTKHTLISKDELVKHLAETVQKNEGFEDVTLGIYVLREMDEHGSNWSPSIAKITGIPKEIWRPIIHKVVTDAKMRFNVA